MRVILLVALFCVGASTLEAQRDGNQRAAPVGTAVVSGQAVTTDDPARPLRRVLLTLSGAELRGDRRVMSDDDGRFVFEGLAAGRYTLMAEKPAYVTTHHGSPRPGYGPGAPLAIADGQATQVVLRIPRGSVIGGVVRTQDGQPLAGAGVQLFRIQSTAGQLRAVPVPGVLANVATDDRGRFRFYGLPPGEYVVRGGGGYGTAGEIRLTSEAELAAAAKTITAVTRSGPAPLAKPVPSAPAPRVIFAAVYAPNSTDLEGADRFRVGMGQEIPDADLTVGLVRTGAISGISVGPDGEPLPDVMVSVVNTRTRSMWASPGVIRPDADGRFKLAGLAEGDYALIGRAVDPSLPQGHVALYAETPFTMFGEDLSNLQLSFQRGTTVSGRVEISGIGSAAGLRLGLVPIGTISGAAAVPATEGLQAGGTFTFTGVAPGRYRVTATGAANLTLRSAMLGEVDTLDGSFEVPDRQDVTGLRVVLTSEPAQISGTLFDGLGRPSPEFAVIVFSTDRSHWASAPRRMSGLVKLDSLGAYRINGLPPGTYYLAAVTDAEPSDLIDSAFLEQLASAALTLTLGEGEQKVQDLKLK